MNRFIGHSQVVTTNNYNTLSGLHTGKITVTITHEIKSWRLLAESLLGNESYLINTSTTESSNTESESYVTTDGQSASLSWNKAPIWGLRPDFYYCLTLAGLLIRGALSDVTIAAGPRQRGQSWVRVPLDSWPYFTVSDSRLPFSSLLRLEGLRWRYLTPPAHGFTPVVTNALPFIISTPLA
jgi:hypothetical protein